MERVGSRRSLRAVLAWSAFDWANSPFPTLITTFVFSTYFVKAVAPTPEAGTALWGWAVSCAGIAIALLAPVAGAIADRAGRRKPWLAATVLICALASASMWWVRPDEESVPLALVLLVLATIGFEVGTSFYNAMLPEIAPPEKVGRISGWAWGLGYAGGLAALVLALVAFVKAETPLFGLDKGAAEHVRIVGPLVAVWMIAFAAPLFLWVPDVRSRSSVHEAVRLGLRDILHIGRLLRAHPGVGRFLIAAMIYTDGINTLFSFGAIYAAGTFGLDTSEVIVLGIALNVTAGLGAAAFGWIDDRLGSKRTVMIGLIGLFLIGAALLVVADQSVFMALAVAMGVFFGPVQAASRSLMARIAPAEVRAELFGLLALSGKITSFAGPLVLGWATVTFASQRAGMATILVFLGIGMALLMRVREYDQS